MIKFKNTEFSNFTVCLILVCLLSFLLGVAIAGDLASLIAAIKA